MLISFLVSLNPGFSAPTRHLMTILLCLGPQQVGSDLFHPGLEEGMGVRAGRQGAGVSTRKPEGKV